MAVKKLRFLCLIAFIQIIFILVVSCEFKKLKPNIILIVPDALRAKQLPDYGYKDILTPNIDKLVKDSVTFKRFFVRTPMTTASFSCLFSGLLFPSSGLMEGEKTLAQHLKEGGYRTVGVVSSNVLWSYEFRGISQFNRGFEEYIQDEQLNRYPFFRENEETTQDVLTVLEKNKEIKKPFFLFVHYMDPHEPYRPSYDKEIEKIDTEIGKITNKLKELELYDNSMIIFTSDHGESLGDTVADHGIPQGHGWSLHTEQIHVPLIIKFPDNQYVQSVDQIVRQIDLMPTILDYVGIEYEKKKSDGKSLLPAVKKNKNLELISLHLGNSHRVSPEGSMAVIFKNNGDFYHFIRGKFSDHNQKLYNITKDPDERHNLIQDEEFSEIKLKSENLLEIVKSKVQVWREERGIEKSEIIDESRMEALVSLGYIAGGAPAPTIWESAFFMQKRIHKVGELKYFCHIRKPKWGIKRKDKNYPIKIMPLDNKRSYIIANRNKELFKYHFQNGFKKMGIQNINDMAYNKILRKIYLLKEDGIYSLDPVKRTIREYETEKVRSLWPVHSICIDGNGNFYLFKEQFVVKMDNWKNSGKVYNFKQKNSLVFAVDHQENMYFAEKNTILKYNKQGKKIKSFPITGHLEEVSSVCIDKNQRLWVLEKSIPHIHIFNLNGEKISSFLYNNYKIAKKGRRWPPVPTHQIYLDDKLFLIDNWEVILVYSLHKP